MIVVIDLKTQLTKIRKRLLSLPSNINLIMVIVRLSLTKFVELCTVTKNLDDIIFKLGELIYLANRPEKKLSLQALMIFTI